MNTHTTKQRERKIDPLHPSTQPTRRAANSAVSYGEAIDSLQIQSLLNEFLSVLFSYNEENVNLAFDNMNSIFEKAAKRANLKKKKEGQ